MEELGRELQNAKKQARLHQDSIETLQQKIQEYTENLELITLDKEMAEEKAELAQQEVELLKEKIEEISLDLDVLKQEREGIVDV